MTKLRLVGCSGARDLDALLRDARDLPLAVDLIEVRLDRFPHPAQVDLPALVQALGRPAILTVRSRVEGGEFSGSSGSRGELLQKAARSGFAWVDLERDVAGAVPPGGARRIISWHGTTEGDGAGPVRDLYRFEGDIVKVAATPTDAAAALHFVRSATALGQQLQQPVAAIAMGPAGRFLRPLAGRFNMPLLYAAIHASKKTAAGQITVAEALEVHDVHRIADETRVYAVAGGDVRDSFSPHAHNHVFRTLQEDAVYVDLSSTTFDAVATVARELPLGGLSVTMPFKLAALDLGEPCTPDAREIGAVNTLVRDSQGQFHGSNTDRPGFLAALDLACAHPQTVVDVALGRSLDGLLQLDGVTATNKHRGPLETALLFGSGGVARAIAHGLVARGIRVWVAGRSPRHVTELVVAMGHGVEALSPGRARSLHFDLLVKAVSDQAWDELPFDPPEFGGSGFAADVVITPRETPFLLAARRAGRTPVPGLLMFSEQAVLQAAAFVGATPEKVRPAIVEGIASRLRR